MSDRHATIPPPPDRTRQTDPPLPTDKAPPEILQLSEQVALTISSIESRLGRIEDGMAKVSEVHELLMGGFKDGKRVGSIIDALHETNNRLGVLSVNSELMLEKHREYVNEVSRVHHENIQLKIAVRELEARLDRVDSERPLPNGNGHI